MDVYAGSMRHYFSAGLRKNSRPKYARNRRAGKGRKFRQSVGKGTWIGGRVTVLGETSIGNACVVAGCACVVKSVGDNMLVGGVPARSIRNLECIEKTVTE